MTDFLLTVVIIIFGVLGFFLMKRIDRFLESSRKEQVKLLESSEHYLRIGTSNPYVIDCCSEAFLAHKLDLLLLSENSVVKMDGCCLKEIELPCTSTMMSGSSLTVELVGEKQSKLTAFWKQDNKSQLITEFLKYSDEISHYI